MNSLAAQQSKNKLTEGTIQVVTRYDGETEDLIDIYRLNPIPGAEFIDHFDVDLLIDPALSDRYSITPEDINFLKPFIKAEVNFDFAKFAYFIETVLDDVNEE